MEAVTILDELVNHAEADWLALWMIVDEVETKLSPDDEEEVLEITIALVEGLLARGFLAGDSPGIGDSVHFTAWPCQDAHAIGQYIRRSWTERAGPPGWGDAPWFATRRLAQIHA